MTKLIWDIQEEHLDEAEFLLEMHTNCMDSPKSTLAQVQAGPERRLLARIDALLVGGQSVIDRLLLPVLAEPDDEFRTAAATLTILHGAGLEACARVLAALDSVDMADRIGDAGRRGLIRGLGLVQRSGLIDWLARDLDQHSGPRLAARLRVFEQHRVDVGPRMIVWLASGEPEIARAAARLARHVAAPELLRHLHASMRADDASLRLAAIESALIRGLPGAWETMCNEAFGVRDHEALAWVGLLGSEATHHRLLSTLAAAPTPALVWAAGLTGRVAAVDAVLALLEHPRLARLAGEVVFAIAGLPLHEDRFWLDRGGSVGTDEDEALPTLDADDLDADLVPSGDAALRKPNAEEIRAWWAGRRQHLSAHARHSLGHPLDAAQLARSLHALPTRRRHLLALELAARTQGRTQLATHALASVQLAQTNAVFANLEPIDLQRGLQHGL